MAHVKSHKGELWNEMADSLAEAAMNGFCVPGCSYMCCDASEV